MRKRIGIFFIIAGLLIIAWASYARYDTNRKMKVMIKQFNETAEDYNEQQNDTTSDYTVKKDAAPEVEGMIGILEIPKIELKVAVVDGVDARSLKKAAGHFKETAYPGEKGNCAISGHRSFTYNQFFNRLNEVNQGDEISISTKTGNYKYVVYKKWITDPNDISVLSKTDEDVITLITCHPEHSSAQRLIIRGRLEFKTSP